MSENDPLIGKGIVDVAESVESVTVTTVSEGSSSATYSTQKTSRNAGHPLSLWRRIKKALLYICTFLARLFVGEPKRVTVEAVKVHVHNLPESLSGFKIVFLSDFHFNQTDHYMRRVRAELLDDIVAKTAALGPDLVLLGGDYVDWESSDIDAFAQQWGRRLAQIPRYGAYGVLGNHDQFLSDSKRRVASGLREAGVHILDNETAVPVPGLAVIGAGDWTSSGDFRADEAFAQVEAAENSCSSESNPNNNNGSDGVFRVLLTHNPDCTPSLGEHKADLQLCGHTHGGQIRFPGIGPLAPFLAVKMRLAKCNSMVRNKYNAVKNWEWAAGAHTIRGAGHLGPDKTLYVTRGIGTHPPMRLFCAPELTLITLEKEEDEEKEEEKERQTS